MELPDGRVQIVTYHADHEHGFIADVKYEGVAHEEPYHAPAAPYHAAPLVHGPLAHGIAHGPIAHGIAHGPGLIGPAAGPVFGK